MSTQKKLPLVYSCSGASSAAQMANHIAVRLNRSGVAEMSCIAGVGGDVKPLVQTARSGRPIIAIDGCPLHCVAQVLKRHGLQPIRHYDLNDAGVKKQPHEDFDPREAAVLLDRIVKETRAFVASGSGAAESPLGPMTMLPEPASPVCYLREFEE